MDDVIVVTINYRLNIFGFACIPELGIYGNAGLKDQQMAIEWVHENIEYFGGDSRNVTLFGESSGAASVHLHALNEKSRKYFHKIILQSGTALNNFFIQPDSKKKTRRLAKKVGGRFGSPQEIYDSLITANMQEMVIQSKKCLDSEERRRMPPTCFKPMIEMEHENAFLTKLPIELIKFSQLNMPMMIGVTNKEGTGPTSVFRNNINHFGKDLIKLVPRSIRIHPDGPEASDLIDEIRKFYFNSENVTSEKFAQLVDLAGDTFFVNYTVMTSELYQKYQPNCQQYLFEFGLDTRLNFMKSLMNVEDIKGAAHFDDISYLFGHKIIDLKIPKNSIEWKLRSTICKLWTNFAKCSDPTPERNNPLTTKWKHVEDSGQYLRMSNDEFSMDRTQFWKRVYEKYNGSFHNPYYEYVKY